MVFRHEGAYRCGQPHRAYPQRQRITPANVHDSQELPNLLHGNEPRLYGDSTYTGQKEVLEQIAPNAKDFTNKLPLHTVQHTAKVHHIFNYKNEAHK